MIIFFSSTKSNFWSLEPITWSCASIRKKRWR